MIFRDTFIRISFLCRLKPDSLFWQLCIEGAASEYTAHMKMYCYAADDGEDEKSIGEDNQKGTTEKVSKVATKSCQ